jgi:hypothetical protein
MRAKLVSSPAVLCLVADEKGYNNERAMTTLSKLNSEIGDQLASERVEHRRAQAWTERRLAK